MCSHVGRCNPKSVVKLVILTVCVLGFLPLARGLSIPDLYPFGRSTSDNRTQATDDGGSQKIRLKNSFKFFGKNKSSLFVNNNGLITFDEQLNEYKPQSFPLNQNTPLIAPFWADVDVSRDWNNGIIWYRQEYNSDLLTRASGEIQSYFISQRNFQANWLFIATWDKVGFYGASGPGQSKSNTFQAVLVKNEKRSFVIFNYLRIDWTTGSNSLGNTHTGLGGSPAQAGFNAGDRKNYYSIEGAQTDAVINLTQTSNVGIPGKWVFQVDGNSILDIKCSHAEQIDVFPKSGSMFGGEEIRISGPCFSSDFTILARIKETNDTFQCTTINDVSAACIMPSVFRTGQVTLEVNPYGMGWNYSSTFQIENVVSLTPKINRHNPDSWIMNHNVTMSWNASLTPSPSQFLDIMAYQNANDSKPRFVVVRSEPLDFSIPHNTSNIVFNTFTLSGILLENMTSLVLRIRSNITAGFSSIWSDVFPVRWLSATNAENMCQNWMKKQSPISSNTESTCPCTLKQASRDTGRYFVDPLCSLHNEMKVSNCLYNKGAAQCFRRTLHSFSVSGETCCYNSEGELLDAREAPHGGGTRSLFHINAQSGDIVPFFSYFQNHLVPFVQCCHFSCNNSMCQRFLELRPPTSCQAYTPPTPAQAAGDPHLTTLDRKDYTFNGIGDFVLLQDVNSSMVVQVRAIQTRDTNGILQNASVFSAVAMKTKSSDKIEIYKTSEGTADILVNNETVDLVEATSNFNDVNLERSESDDSVLNVLVVFESEDLSVSLDVSKDYLNVLVMISGERYKGQIRGLLGNFNGDDNDDFVSRQNTVLPSDASMKDLHYKFGMTWEVQSTESLFTRPNTGVNTVNYEPVFLDDIRNPELNLTFVVELCGDNKQCQYDYSVTGNENIAKGTMKFIEKFKEIEIDVQEVVRCPFKEVPTNGNRSVSGYSIGDNTTFWCYEGFQLIQGASFMVCNENGVWSGSTPMCVRKVVKDDPVSALVIYIGSGAGALIAFVVIAIVILAFVKCRRKPKPDPDLEINGPIFQNPFFLESLSTLGNGGVFKIPRPTYVDPNLLDDYFF
ncbi:sushi domain-containing protein 2-like [Ostrea edulis]|uniref:sushi domain-containing protein 2-like n=1 Tax=Ostrea edulis TaxID=37623 RepID=UPI0024AEF934|nr:sushi domain-containing protein 2-like [Ostrea edulis]